MPNMHVRVAVCSCRLYASVWPCKSQQSIVGQSALVMCLSKISSIFRLQSLSSAARTYLKRSPIIWKTTSRIGLNYGAKRNRWTPALEHQHEEHSPATSASSERVFSKSGILMSPIRSRMSSKTLEMRTFLKSCYGFVDNPAPVAKAVEISSKQ